MAAGGLLAGWPVVSAWYPVARQRDRRISKEFSFEGIAPLRNRQRPVVTNELLFAKESLDDMTEVEDIPYDGKKRVIILDDMINEGKKENLKKVAEYFTSGRHKGCSCIFLTQSYIQTPKIIRENTSFFCFFKLNRREITEIAKTLANDIALSQFREMFTEATQEPFTFFTIDMTQLSAQYPLLKYRKGLDGLAIYEDDEENENLNQL